MANRCYYSLFVLTALSSISMLMHLYLKKRIKCQTRNALLNIINNCCERTKSELIYAMEEPKQNDCINNGGVFS